MPSPPLTNEQREDAARLKQYFKDWQQRQRDAGAQYSQESASESLGFNQSALSQYLNGRIPLNVPTLVAFCNLMGVMPNEISPRLAESMRVPTGNMSNEELIKMGFMPVRVVEDDDPFFVHIPKVKLRLSAGISGFDVEPEPYDGSTTAIPKAWIARSGYSRENLVAIHVRGESMEPTVYEGDLVVLNTADTEPADGGVFAINYEGEPLIKRMERDAGEWWLKSDNLDQRKFGRKICKGDACIIVGRVVRKESTRF